MTLTKSQRGAVFAMFGGKCAYCGTVLPERGWHADHVEAVFRKSDLVRDEKTDRWKFVKTGDCWAPENERLDNFMPACRPCNIDKATASVEEWRKALEHKPEVLRANYSAFRHAERFGLVAQVETKVVFYFEQAGGTHARSQQKEVSGEERN